MQKDTGYKNFSCLLKDMDEKTGRVLVYANAFNNIDSDGDISAPGSFSKTLKENRNRSKWFLNHDKKILLGVPFLERTLEDEYGLLADNQFNLEKEIARDTMTDYLLYQKFNRTLEHSIGYDVVKRDAIDKRIIKEYKLWEMSTLTAWGANEKTPAVELKSKDEILESIRILNGMFEYQFKYSAERLKEAEKLMKKLETLLIEPVSDHSNPEPFDAIEYLKNNLKILN